MNALLKLFGSFPMYIKNYSCTTKPRSRKGPRTKTIDKSIVKSINEYDIHEQKKQVNKQGNRTLRYSHAKFNLLGDLEIKCFLPEIHILFIRDN